MEISYICEFVTLAETCNYMEAADQLFISQSALSRHIKTLEDDLGVQLFDRTTRKVSLSEFGSLFLPFARQIATIRYEYEATISAAKMAEHDHIRIGSIPTMINYHITDLLANFQKSNPGISMDVFEGDTLELTKMLRSGQCDLAFLRQTEESAEDLNMLPFQGDQIVAIMSRKHPFASRSYIRTEQLKNEPLILLSRNTYMYSLCVNTCKKAGFEPHIMLTMHRADNMLDFVRKGMGIALLNRGPTESMLTDDLVAIDIEPRIFTHVALAYPKGKQLNAGAKRFINMIQIIKE